MTTTSNDSNLPTRKSIATRNGNSDAVLSGEVVSDAGPKGRPLPAAGQFAVGEDPLVELFIKHWRTLAIGIVLVGAIVYGESVYRTTQLRAQENSGDSFVGLQRTFGEVQESRLRAAGLAQSTSELPSDATTKEPGKNQEQLQTANKEIEQRLESQIRSLSFAKAPYPELAEFYAKLNKITSGDLSDASKAARDAALKGAAFQASAPNSIERLTGELLTLAAARALIDHDLVAARAALETLANFGEYTAAAAAKSLLKLADTGETRAHARTVQRNVLAKRPELEAEFAQE